MLLTNFKEYSFNEISLLEYTYGDPVSMLAASYDDTELKAMQVFKDALDELKENIDNYDPNWWEWIIDFFTLQWCKLYRLRDLVPRMQTAVQGILDKYPQPTESDDPSTVMLDEPVAKKSVVSHKAVSSIKSNHSDDKPTIPKVQETEEERRASELHYAGVSLADWPEDEDGGVDGLWDEAGDQEQPLIGKLQTKIELKAVVDDYLASLNKFAGEAVDNGDCFFDALAQVINTKLDEHQTVATLREIVSKEVLRLDSGDDKDNWVKKYTEENDLMDTYAEYRDLVGEDCGSAVAKGKFPVWGDLKREGRILADHFNIQIIVHQIDKYDEGFSKGAVAYYPKHANQVEIALYAMHHVPVFDQVQEQI